MKTFLDQLKSRETALITDFDTDIIPLKLLEMGCLPGNQVTLLAIAPFGDPLYLDINGSHLAIRTETAQHIAVEVVS